ncbi:MULTISPECIES: CcdB family protein [Inquilinus]|uniref:Toxin CcdB n=1 Tax=Inquilinus ginsengisoli TaxID=363840 RepID=A0ABU1JG61_9PROT|nr:CcdB family protein [Inquilinus ginsengisoli]MDR6287605.1 toxin CcdB [Inquilinus ginsengisoli]
MRFDVHRLKGADDVLALGVQSEFHDHLQTRIIVPMVPVGSYPAKPMVRLEPILSVDGQQYVLVTTDMASIPIGELGDVVASLADQHSVIVDALDFLLQGF